MWWTKTSARTNSAISRMSGPANRLDRVLRTLDYIEEGWRGSLRQLQSTYLEITERSLSTRQISAALEELSEAGIYAVERLKLGPNGLSIRLVEEAQSAPSASPPPEPKPSKTKPKSSGPTDLTLTDEERAEEERARAQRLKDREASAELREALRKNLDRGKP